MLSLIVITATIIVATGYVMYRKANMRKRAYAAMRNELRIKATQNKGV